GGHAAPGPRSREQHQKLARHSVRLTRGPGADPSVAHVPSVSSLIFVVILAVWAVYLVQHWVRRRDHLATARSVDRFSEAMRVLERRRALPRPETVQVAPRAYDTSPLRPARPEVVVKRTDAGGRVAPVAHGARAVAPPPGVRRARFANRLRGTALLVSSVVL